VRLIDDAALFELGLAGTPATVGVRPGASTLAAWLGPLGDERIAEVLEWAQSSALVAAADSP
jgi:hypothetical protein